MGEHQEARCKRVAMRMCERQAQEERLGHKSGSSKHPMIRSSSRQQDEGMDNRSSEHTGDRVGAQMRREGTDEGTDEGDRIKIQLMTSRSR